MSRRKIPFTQQQRFQIEYKVVLLDKEYIADYVCFDQIIVEIKALSQLSPVDWSQVIDYLKVSKKRVGLLFNFGSVGRLEWKKLVIWCFDFLISFVYFVDIKAGLSTKYTKEENKKSDQKENLEHGWN